MNAKLGVISEICCTFAQDNKKSPKLLWNGLFWGKRKNVVMAKVQQISEITPSFAFTEFDFYKDYEKSFQKSEIGRILEASMIVLSIERLRYKLLAIIYANSELRSKII